MSRVLTFLAEGYEEIEALAVIDILRRAGVTVDLVSISDELLVTSSHNVTVLCDKLFDDVDFEEAEMLFLPGGMPGTKNLAACKKLEAMILKFNDEGKKLTAICAAPSVYGMLGLLKGKKATCFPSFEDKLLGATQIGGRVVTDGNITTSKGMGTAVDLGLELLAILEGQEKSDKIKGDIQY